MMCPGQDTRYWRPDDIFNVPCASCGAAIEFFKDDAARRCPRCGTRVRNPRLSTGCAQWCRHAKECLGYDPAIAAEEGPVAVQSVEGDIIDAMKNECGEVLGRARAACRNARTLMERNPADPGRVIPAVLLLFADTPDGRAERIMREARVERGAIEDACAIIRAYHSGAIIDSPEFRIVAESYDGPDVDRA